MSVQPKFSVIIASFNAAATLAQAIDSVLAQSYPAYEIIIIDDGSTDNTAAVVSRYGSKVRYFFQQNTGVSGARNNGAQLANGDWLAFLDADDHYYPHRLAQHQALLQQHPEVDFLIGDYHYGCADGSIIRRSIESSAFGSNTLTAADQHAHTVLEGTAMAGIIADYFGHTLTFSLPRTTFLALGGYDRAFSIGEDLHLLIRLCLGSNKIGVVCQPLGFYCVNDAGLMRANVVTAQVKTVAMLCALKPVLQHAPMPIKQGFLLALFKARADLASAQVRQGQRLTAIVDFLPALTESLSWRSVRLLLSLIKTLLS